jgi:hypothetical protein
MKRIRDKGAEILSQPQLLERVLTVRLQECWVWKCILGQEYFRENAWKILNFVMSSKLVLIFSYLGARGGAVSWGTELQTGRLRVRFSGVIRIFLLCNSSGRTMALGWIQPLTEMSTRNISWGGKGGRCVGLTTLPTYVNSLEILGGSTSWNPEGLSRPVMELFITVYTCDQVNKMGPLSSCYE